MPTFLKHDKSSCRVRWSNLECRNSASRPQKLRRDADQRLERRVPARDLVLGVAGEQQSGLSSRSQEEQLGQGERPLAGLGQLGDVLPLVVVRDLQDGHLTKALLAADQDKKIKSKQWPSNNKFRLEIRQEREIVIR